MKGATDTALMLQQIFDRHGLTGTILLTIPPVAAIPDTTPP